MSDGESPTLEPEPIPDADQIARVQTLREQLDAHAHRYYVLDEPRIPDAEYDRLFRELESLERQFASLVTTASPTQRVGATPSNAFAEVHHAVPMLSLGNEFFRAL